MSHTRVETNGRYFVIMKKICHISFFFGRRSWSWEPMRRQLSGSIITCDTREEAEELRAEVEKEAEREDRYYKPNEFVVVKKVPKPFSFGIPHDEVLPY